MSAATQAQILPLAARPGGPARLLPGLLLCLAVTVAAVGLEHAETWVFGRAWLEPLVLAILLGAALRTAWTPGAHWHPGIAFSAKFLLELAVVLLGASVSAATILAVGPALLLGITGFVVVAVLGGYGLCRLLGLPRRMAILVACGNAICGNSAIAAVAPVIGADGDEVAASIAFTAVLGVAAVLGLPLLVPLLGLSGTQFGVLAGLTVYAVPQVLAATAPLGVLAVQVGTLVKLVRVLMLGPVVLVLSLLTPRLREAPGAAAPHVTAGDRPTLHRLVPWFILGFLAMSLLRSLGLIPQPVLAPLAGAASALTVISMAALGLGVDVRTVARAGGRVSAAVSLSLLALGAIALGLIRLLGVA
ncbi:putative integral membrane protein (TIGR00698 family) [Humitalea rosea]|uniref:Putative integral membrane protein (TIGR00698 family) n=1 Tax=Humitalea rosea TaxID=990373 RepID=A0A2W7ILZ1_9PROT|nr:putative sulfate exporter family transporter [Humitalea rosea]PZW48077.1 putative integral membrane protein (TIGR00698 family) [Humitalea rosea]